MKGHSSCMRSYPWLPPTGQPSTIGGGKVAFNITFQSTENQQSCIKAKLTFMLKSPDGGDHGLVFTEGLVSRPGDRQQAAPASTQIYLFGCVNIKSEPWQTSYQIYPNWRANPARVLKLALGITAA